MRKEHKQLLDSFWGCDTFKDIRASKKNIIALDIIKMIKTQKKEFTANDIYEDIKRYYIEKNCRSFIHDISIKTIYTLLDKMVKQDKLVMELFTIYEYKEVPNLLYRGAKVYRQIAKTEKRYKNRTWQSPFFII